MKIASYPSDDGRVVIRVSLDNGAVALAAYNRDDAAEMGANIIRAAGAAEVLTNTMHEPEKMLKFIERYAARPSARPPGGRDGDDTDGLGGGGEGDV